ncbi:MAG: hypothetical protein ACRC1K_13640, partial [Planctomycetia bacterium]
MLEMILKHTLRFGGHLLAALLAVVVFAPASFADEVPPPRPFLYAADPFETRPLTPPPPPIATDPPPLGEG